MADAAAKIPPFTVPGADTDERAKIQHTADSRIADVLGQIAALVPDEKSADFCYQVMRLQDARTRADLFSSQSWLRTVDQAYLAGRRDLTRELMGDPPAALDLGDITIVH